MRDTGPIAVIDDDEGVRVSLDGLLRSLGYRTVLFDCGEAFLASDSVNESLCVISDIHMPGGMSGLDLAGHLAKVQPAMPVILMSAFADRECQEQATRSRICCILAKPFDDDTLIACLDQALAA